MSDMIFCAIRNIKRKKLRSFLTSIGVAIGVASVVLIGNISQCGFLTINNELDSLGLGGLTISTSYNTACPEKKLLSDWQLDAIKNSEHVSQAMPLISRTADVTAHNTRTNAMVFGIGDNANQIISLSTIYGRHINKSDISSGSSVCMIEQKFSQKLYSRDNIIGKKIQVAHNSGCETYEVIGIVKTGNGLLGNVLGNYMPDFVYVPYSSIQNTQGSKTFDQIAIKTEKNPNFPVEEIGNKLVDMLEARSISGEKYKSSNLSKQREGFVKLFDIITVILSAIGAISLFIASLSIMIVMLVSVNERVREIGIKKSIGASKKSIMLEFLLEAALLTLLGSVIGIISGNIIFWIGSKVFGFSFVIKIESILMGFVLSMGSGLCFGIFPAYKASKLNPVEALSRC